MEKQKGYYEVKFFNHSKIMIMYWNGERYEAFKSDEAPNDEIEMAVKITTTVDNSQDINN